MWRFRLPAPVWTPRLSLTHSFAPFRQRSRPAAALRHSMRHVDDSFGCCGVALFKRRGGKKIIGYTLFASLVGAVLRLILDARFGGLCCSNRK
jgi:hypothetical protein